MAGRRLFGASVLATAFVALCCFTPLLAAIGAGAILAWADYVLLPLLLLLGGFTWLAWRRLKSSDDCCDEETK